MRCPNCGIETNEKVCPNCGANFQKTINKIKCPNCGIETTEKICPNCGADFSKTITTTSSENKNDEPKKAEQEARIESSPLETFLNYTPTAKMREPQPQKQSGFSSEMKKPVFDRGWPTWAKVLAFIAGIVLIILGIFLMCEGCSSGEKEDTDNEGRIEYTWKAEAYIEPLDEY